MRTVVTGCCGFIGSNLTDSLLKMGHKVYGIDSFTDYYSRKLKENNISDALNHKNFQLIEKDINQIEEFPIVDQVFHLAAQAGVRASWGKTFEIYTKSNISATQKLLEFYRSTELKSFIYSSSSSVYGNVELPYTENAILKPISPYGVTKLAGEHLCYLYWKNFKVPTISLRYFTVYGPRLRPDMGIYKFVDSIVNDKQITLYGDGNQTRDFTYVSDIVNANILAANSLLYGEAFNIGGGNRISVIDTIKIIENILGKKSDIKFVEKQYGDVDNTWADISKAENLLNWRPEINITKGLKIYTNWFLDNYP